MRSLSREFPALLLHNRSENIRSPVRGGAPPEAAAAAADGVVRSRFQRHETGAPGIYKRGEKSAREDNVNNVRYYSPRCLHAVVKTRRSRRVGEN